MVRAAARCSSATRADQQRSRAIVVLVAVSTKVALLLGLAVAIGGCRHEPNISSGADGSADAATDAAQPDTTSDAPAGDAPADASADGVADLLVIDVVVRDLVGPSACAITKITEVGPFFLCGGAAKTQCEAHELCGSGYRLCTANEYYKDIKGTSPYFTVRAAAAWIAGCVRDGNQAAALLDGVCSTCDTTTISSVSANVSNVCGAGCTAPATNALQHVGVVTDLMCNSLGATCPAGANVATYWQALTASAKRDRALCCKSGS